MWRRYLGEVGKFYRTFWLVYPRYCISISIKIGQVLYRSYDKLEIAAQGVAQCKVSATRVVADAALRRIG